MNHFEYSNRTKIVFGSNATEKVGDLANEFGKRILIVYGRNSCIKSGLLEKVEKQLKTKNLDILKLGGVEPNPKMGLAYKGIEICKKEKVDGIIAIGGGSVIDTCKVISLGSCYNGDAWDFFTGTRINQSLPLGVILTIPAAGSESSTDAVMTNEHLKLKRATFAADFLRPVFAILNPELTFTLPPYQTACGATDIIAHVLERYFTNTTAVDVTDRLCESLVQSVIFAAPRVLNEPNNYDYRAEIMLAGCYAHNNIVGVGRVQDWASHSLGHEVSALTDAAHGATLAIIYPAWMKYVYKNNVKRFAQFANRIFNVPYIPGDEKTMALEGIKRFEQFLHSMKLPKRLSDLGITESDIPIMAKKCHKAGNFVELNESDIAEIYRSAL